MDEKGGRENQQQLRSTELLSVWHKASFFAGRCSDLQANSKASSARLVHINHFVFLSGNKRLQCTCDSLPTCRGDRWINRCPWFCLPSRLCWERQPWQEQRRCFPQITEFLEMSKYFCLPQPGTNTCIDWTTLLWFHLQIACYTGRFFTQRCDGWRFSYKANFWSYPTGIASRLGLSDDPVYQPEHLFLAVYKESRIPPFSLLPIIRGKNSTKSWARRHKENLFDSREMNKFL